MTAPTWTQAEVSGMPTLLRDGQPVAYLDGAMLHVSPWFAEQALAALTQLFAPDEATLMLLSQRVDSHALTLDDEAGVRDCVEDVLAALADSRDPLAALAGTPAQARHTDDEATGGA